MASEKLIANHGFDSHRPKTAKGPIAKAQYRRLLEKGAGSAILSRETIAGALSMDLVLLGTDFKAATGKYLKQYVNQLRLDHAYRLLLETRDKIIDIAYESGFESLRTFNRVFFHAMGDTPSIYRKLSRSKHKAAVRPGKPDKKTEGKGVKSALDG